MNPDFRNDDIEDTSLNREMNNLARRVYFNALDNQAKATNFVIEYIFKFLTEEEMLEISKLSIADLRYEVYEICCTKLRYLNNRFSFDDLLNLDKTYIIKELTSKILQTIDENN